MNQIFESEVGDLEELSGYDYSEQKSDIGSDDENNDNDLKNDEDDEGFEMLEAAFNEVANDTLLDEIENKNEDDSGEIVEYFGIEHNLYHLEKDFDDLVMPEVTREQFKKWYPNFEHGQRLVMSKLFPAHHSWLKCHMESVRKKKIKNSKEDEMEISHDGSMRSPASHEIEEDTMKYSIADAEGFHSINRLGPCKIWYDKLKVPIDADSFNYNCMPGPTTEDVDLIDKAVEDLETSFHRDFQFKRKRKLCDNLVGPPSCKRLKKLSEKFCMGSIVFDPKAQKNEVIEELIHDLAHGNFHETPEGRHLMEELKQNRCEVKLREEDGTHYLPDMEPPPMKTFNQQFKDKYSCYDNVEVCNGSWVEDIIWDNEDLEKLGAPKPVIVDKMMFSHLVDDLENDLENEEDKEDEEDEIVKQPIRKKISFLMDDEYYPTNTSPTTATNGFRHSQPVDDLNFTIFPPIFGNEPDLLNFHRPQLKVGAGERKVYNLKYEIENMKETIKRETAKGNPFHMDKMSDLTGRHGDIILMELAEDFPLLMNQLGMANKICNYYKEGHNPPVPKFGENVRVKKDEKLFLGDLKSDECLSAVVNNMYRAPIFEHVMKNTDFLIILTDNCFFIRTVDALFAVGQQCPLIEVPKPYSKSAQTFISDYFMLYANRLFRKCKTNNSLTTQKLREAFPYKSDNYFRTRLKEWSGYNRHANLWELRPDLHLPDEKNLAIDLTPELYCAFKSMRKAEVRLTADGHLGKEFGNERTDDDISVGDDKLSEKFDVFKSAPWSTTSAFVSATNGKSLLDLNMDTDPTDCGIGYCYVKAPIKPIHSNNSENDKSKKFYKTEYDYRKMTIAMCKVHLRKLGVPDSVVNKIIKDNPLRARFMLVQMIKEICTDKQRKGDKSYDNFARSGISATQEHKTKLLDKCQDAFDKQNRFLGQETSDEAFLLNELLFQFMEVDDQVEEEVPKPPKNVKKLIITRTIVNERGMPERQEEIVTDQLLIERYVNKREEEEKQKKDLKEGRESGSSNQSKPKNKQSFKKKTVDLTEEQKQVKREERRMKKRELDRKRYRERKGLVEVGNVRTKNNNKTNDQTNNNFSRKFDKNKAPFKDSSNRH